MVVPWTGSSGWERRTAYLFLPAEWHLGADSIHKASDLSFYAQNTAIMHQVLVPTSHELNHVLSITTTKD